jgi:hypothetical protein
MMNANKWLFDLSFFCVHDMSVWSVNTSPWSSSFYVHAYARDRHTMPSGEIESNIFIQYRFPLEWINYSSSIFFLFASALHKLSGWTNEGKFHSLILFLFFSSFDDVKFVMLVCLIESAEWWRWLIFAFFDLCCFFLYLSTFFFLLSKHAHI